MHALTLSLQTLGSHQFLLRDLDGQLELLASADDPDSANRILSGCLLESDGSPVDLAQLLTSWRDRALAEMYRHAVGDKVECKARCSQCDEQYEFAFSLGGIIRQQDEAAAASELTLDDDGRWQLEGGATVRPPTLADIAAAADAQSLGEILAEGKANSREVDAALELASPLLDFDLASTCPECDSDQQIAFEIGAFLVSTLSSERAFLLRETHLIASRYGWNHASIMALPRRDRQAYAALIESERSASMVRRA